MKRILFVGLLVFTVGLEGSLAHPLSVSSTTQSKYLKTIRTRRSRDLDDYLKGIKQYMNTFEVKDVSFPVLQGSKTDATFIRKGFLTLRPGALATIIICHGYTQSKYDSSFLRTLFPHFNVFAFDFRAHGELTDGQFSTIGQDEMFDVRGAVEYVRSQPELQALPVIGFGFSMGAVSLLQAQSYFENMFDMLILDSPFDSSSACVARRLDEMFTCRFFGKTYKLPGKALVMKTMYNPKFRPMIKVLFRMTTGINPNSTKTLFVPVIPINKAHEVKIPCFFISCEKDTKVTADCVQRLYDAVQSPYKRLWITHGVRHCGSCIAQPELYIYKVNEFIKTVLDGSWTKPEEIQDDRAIIQAQ